MNKTTQERERISTTEAEQQFGISRNYIALLLRNGTIEGEKPSRDWFVYTDSLKDFLAKNRKPGPKGPRKKTASTS